VGQGGTTGEERPGTWSLALTDTPACLRSTPVVAVKPCGGQRVQTGTGSHGRHGTERQRGMEPPVLLGMDRPRFTAVLISRLKNIVD
jgi:hypothetical protein